MKRTGYFITNKRAKEEGFSDEERERQSYALAEEIYSNEHKDDKYAGFGAWEALRHFTDNFDRDTILYYEGACDNLIKALAESKKEFKEETIMLCNLRIMLEMMSGGGFWNYAYYYILSNFPTSADFTLIRRYYFKQRAEYIGLMDDYSKYSDLAKRSGAAHKLIKK